MPQHSIIKTIFWVICANFICIANLSAHELVKDDVLRAHIAMRQKYDQCLEKAEQNANSQKACRVSYAKQRLLSAAELYHIYMEHALEAEELYEDVLLGVRGTVYRVGTTPLGILEVVLGLDDFGMTGVRVEFPPKYAAQVKNLKNGDTITVAAISKGMQVEGFIRLVNAEFIK